MSAISVRGVSKKYRFYKNGRDRLKEILSFGRKEYGHDFWALKDVNLEVQPGTILGILGRNGAGKSTLLSIVSGILQPTSGAVEMNGRLVALFALGAGFNPEFTGRDNILLNGLILGIERQEMLERFDDIAAFADIGEFMDQPIKTYSSGMRSRLGFAVAINVSPDILILDEVLATGDAVFKQAALQKVHELRDSGTTILFVSHNTKSIDDFCTEAIMLHEGRVMATGETAEVIDRYQALVSSIKAQKNQGRIDGGESSEPVMVLDENGRTMQAPGQYQALVSSIRAREKGQRTDGAQPPDQAAVSDEKPPEIPTFYEDPDFEHRVARFRSGTGEARIQGVELLDKRLRAVKAVASGSTVTVRVYLEYLEAVKDSELIIALHDETRLGQTQIQEDQFYGPNLGYVLELYESYREDPGSVDERTQEFFESWKPPQLEANGHAPAVVGELFSASTVLGRTPLEELEKDERIVVDFSFEVPLRKGRYSISAGVRARGEDSYQDKIDVATTLRVKRPRDQKSSHSVVQLPTEIKVYPPEGDRQSRSV